MFKFKRWVIKSSQSDLYLAYYKQHCNGNTQMWTTVPKEAKKFWFFESALCLAVMLGQCVVTK